LPPSPGTVAWKLPTLFNSKFQPSVRNNPKSAAACDKVTSKPPALPWLGPHRPICAQERQAATADLVALHIDQAPKSSSGPPMHHRPASVPSQRRPRPAPLPSLPSDGRLPPRPKSTTGVRQSPYQQADMMAPMMRARHMEILDEQYLKGHGSAADMGKSRMHSRPSYVRRRSPVALPNISGVENVDVVRPPAPRERLLGPQAVMPIVKGQSKVRAQMAQCEATREIEEARLKAQFRSRLSSRSRARSEPRSSKHAASGNV